MAHEMHDTGLYGSIRKGSIDGVRKAFQAIYHGDQDVFHAAIAQVVHD